MVIGIDASRAEAIHKTGVERYSFELLRALRLQLPAGVKVILYSRVPLPPELGPFTDAWQNKVLKWFPKYFWTQLRLTAELFFHRPDVLFVPSAVLPRALGVRTVHTVHDTTFETYPQLYPFWQRTLLKLSLWDSRRASILIVPSRFAAEQLVHVRRTDIVTIPHGVRFETKHAKQGTPLFKDYFLIVGRVDKKKNLLVAIEAFEQFAKKHPGYSLRIVGSFNFGARELVSRIQKSPAVAQIQCMGAVPDTELVDLMEHATALLHPCPVEGFGLPVLEAMHLGTPVVVADGGGAHEVAGDAALVVDASNPALWATAMEQLLFEIFRTPFIEKGKKQAAHYSWQKAAEATWKVLLKK